MARTSSASLCLNRACDSGHSVPVPPIVIHAHFPKSERATANTDSEYNWSLVNTSCKSPQKAPCDNEPAPSHPLPHRLDGSYLPMVTRLLRPGRHYTCGLPRSPGDDVIRTDPEYGAMTFELHT